MCSFTFSFNMKNFLTRILAFTFTVFLLFFVLNIFTGRYNTDPKFYKMQYKAVKETSTRIDGIIIGTSHSLNAIRPSILDSTGISFYNCSLLGAGPEFYNNWYNEWYLKNRPSPKYCIIGIDLFMFDSDWLWRKFEQDSEFFTMSVFLKLLLVSDGFNKKDAVINRFPALKYRKSMLKSLKLQDGDERFPMNYYDRGYIPFQAPYDSTKYKFRKSYKIDSVQVRCFRKLVSKMVSENVQVIFVMSPEYGFPPEYHSKVKTYQVINAMSEKYKIPVLNFNTNLRSYINEDIHYFNDWGHMSVRGSIVFSRQLTKELLRLGFHP